MSAEATPAVVPGGGDAVWFLGTVARMKLTGEQTGRRFALWEGVLPRGASPPLHSHPQDETFYILDGELTVWLVEAELAAAAAAAEDPSLWVDVCGKRCGPGSVAFAPGDLPHTFRVESDTLRMLVLSTPSGIEEMVLGLSEPAAWPWLQPPADGPRVPVEQIREVERATGMVRHGPPPPPA